MCNTDEWKKKENETPWLSCKDIFTIVFFLADQDSYMQVQLLSQKKKIRTTYQYLKLSTPVVYSVNKEWFHLCKRPQTTPLDHPVKPHKKRKKSKGHCDLTLSAPSMSSNTTSILTNSTHRKDIIKLWQSHAHGRRKKNSVSFSFFKLQFEVHWPTHHYKLAIT